MAKPRRRRRALIVGAIVATLAFVIWIFLGWLTVAVATAPRPGTIPPRTELAGHPVESVEAATADGLTVRGWLVKASSRRVVVLLAGIRGNRMSMTALAEHYAERNWAVLMPDLRGTGASDGDRILLGYGERLDVIAWFDWATARGFERIGAHGHSLGAAAIGYALPDIGERCAFVVLDSCYDDLRHALHNRLPWLPLPDVALLPVEWFGAAMLGAPVADLRPVDRLADLRAPLLIVAGDADPKVRMAETSALIAASRSPDTHTLILPGGRHEDLWRRFREPYSRALAPLLR